MLLVFLTGEGMSQAATICRSNFKVSFKAGQTAFGDRGDLSSWQDQEKSIHVGM